MDGHEYHPAKSLNLSASLQSPRDDKQEQSLLLVAHAQLATSLMIVSLINSNLIYKEQNWHFLST